MAYNPNNPNGQATSANSAPVVLSSDQVASGQILATGAKQDTGNTSLSSIATTNSTTATNTARIPAQGSAASSASLPVVVASDQTTIKTKLANDIAASTGTITTSTSVVTTGNLTGVGSATVQLAGTFAGVNVTFEGSVDNTNWIAVPALPLGVASPTAITSTGAISALSVYNIAPVLGLNYLRVRATAYTSGTANVTIQPSAQFYGYNVNAIVTSAPSTAVTGTVTASNVTGNVAQGTAASGNPVRIGGTGKTANPTAVTDGQVVGLTTDKLGKVIAVGSIRDLKGRQNTTLTSTTTETTIVTAGGAGVFNDVYGIIIANTSATGTQIIVRDVTAGGTPLYFWVPANDTRGFMLPEGAALKQGTAASAWTATCGTSVASIQITALYVQNL